MPPKRSGGVPLLRAGMRSGTCDAAAQRAVGDEMLREAEPADVCGDVLADAQGNPGRTCHI